MLYDIKDSVLSRIFETHQITRLNFMQISLYTVNLALSLHLLR